MELLTTAFYLFPMAFNVAVAFLSALVISLNFLVICYKKVKNGNLKEASPKPAPGFKTVCDEPDNVVTVLQQPNSDGGINEQPQQSEGVDSKRVAKRRELYSGGHCKICRCKCACHIAVASSSEPSYKATKDKPTEKPCRINYFERLMGKKQKPTTKHEKHLYFDPRELEYTQPPISASSRNEIVAAELSKVEPPKSVIPMILQDSPRRRVAAAIPKAITTMKTAREQSRKNEEDWKRQNVDDEMNILPEKRRQIPSEAMVSDGSDEYTAVRMSKGGSVRLDNTQREYSFRSMDDY